MGEPQHYHLEASDWIAIHSDPEFRRLAATRRAFVAPATAFFLMCAFAFPALVAFAPGLLARPVFGPVTLAVVLALAEFAMAWIVLALYLLRSRVFDFLEARFVHRIRSRYR